MTQPNKCEHWAPCRNQTPSWYNWKIVESDVTPEQTTTPTTTQGMCSLFWSFSLYKPDSEVWSTCFVQLSASGSWGSGFESLLRHIYHLTERDTSRLTCIASDIRDRVRNRDQDNETNINTGSGVRRIIFKRQQCIYKIEQRYINENLLTRNARASPHKAFFGYSQEIITKSSSLHSRLIFRWRLIRSYSVSSSEFLSKIK